MKRIGYKVSEYPFEYNGEKYIGYVLYRITVNWLGKTIRERITHFTSREKLDEFLSDTFTLDSDNYLVPLKKETKTA